MARPSLLRHPMLWTGLLLLLFLIVFYVLGNQLLTGESVDALPWLLSMIGGPLTVFWLGYFTHRWLRFRRQLSARAKQASLMPEVATAREEFAAVLDELDAVCRDRGHAEGSAGLPWVLLLGPPNAGKTRSLTQAGLHLEPIILSSAAGAGTRRVELWLGDDCVLMDSPGRYLGGARNHDEWLGFLQLLRERRRQPLDSAIVLLDLGELLAWSPEQRLREAREIRARLDELLRDLHVRFPVHLVFNKADRLDGFADYCRGLSVAEQQARWGFTLDLDELAARDPGRSASLGDTFAARFLGLVGLAESRLTSRIIKLAADPAARETALVFPHELQRAADPLRHFVEELFRFSRHGERPLLRAVYFTSATQEEKGAPRPMEPPLRESVCAELHLSPVARRPETGQPSPLFVNGLFRQVLAQAQDAARPTLGWQKRQRLYQRLTLGAAAVLCLLLSHQLASQYSKTQEWFASVTDAASNLYNPDKNLGIADDSFAGLRNVPIETEFTAQDTLLDLLRRDAPSNLTAAVHAAASERLRHRTEVQAILPFLRAGLLIKRLKAGREGSNADEFSDSFNALKATFILKNRHCSGIDPEERRAWIVDYLVKQWMQEVKPDVARKLARSSETSTRSAEAQLEDLLRFYFQKPGVDGKPLVHASFDEDEEKAARQRLAGAATPPGVAFRLIAGNANLMISKPQLRGELIEDSGIAEVFTQTGCNKFFASQNRRGEQWWSCVLERPMSLKSRDLEAEYAKQYKTAWDSWLKNLTLHELDSKHGNLRRDPQPALKALVNALDDLAVHPPTLLVQIMQVMGQGADRTDLINQSLTVAQEAPGGCGQRVAKVPSAVKSLAKKIDACSDPPQAIVIFGLALPVDPAEEKKEKVSSQVRALRGFFKDYSDKLAALRKRLEDLQENADRGPDVVKLVSDTLHGSGELAQVKRARLALIEALTGKERDQEMAERAQALSKLLLGVESAVWKVLVPVAQEALDQQWTAKVYGLWLGYRQAYVPQPFNADACKKIMDFIQKDVKDFAERNIKKFFRNEDFDACEGFSPDEPFNHPRFLISAKVCSLGKIFAEAAPCPAAAPPQPPAPMPKAQSAFETNNISPNTGCQFRIEQARLDNGEKVFECKQSSAGCSELSSVHTEKVARLDVQLKGASEFIKLHQEDSMAKLLGHGSELRHSRYRFTVPPKLIRDCSGFWIELEFGSVEKAKELVDPVLKIGLPPSLTK